MGPKKGGEGVEVRVRGRFYLGEHAAWKTLWRHTFGRPTLPQLPSGIFEKTYFFELELAASDTFGTTQASHKLTHSPTHTDIYMDNLRRASCPSPSFLALFPA